VRNEGSFDVSDCRPVDSVEELQVERKKRWDGEFGEEGEREGGKERDGIGRREERTGCDLIWSTLRRVSGLVRRLEEKKEGKEGKRERQFSHDLLERSKCCRERTHRLMRSSDSRER